MTILFYILVCLMSLFLLFGKLTATSAFVKFVMFVLFRPGGLFVLLYACYQLGKIWGYIP
jgi:hypothetical protein